ncbi:MAG TPA: glycosyltransferase [Vicinamibacterales bacterium]|jgi:glycosyltransferase involved in cell wall biosynthesis|nr:glycosyltransferase [Vicinamibacterales bacterium]
MTQAGRMRVLFFVEGFTDIRFVVGLSEVCDLTLVVPARAFRDSGLDERLRESGARVEVHTIEGGRLAFQWRSLVWLLRHGPAFDVVLAQEMLRGGVNATVAGALRGVPVVTYMGISPIEYFRCRRERGRIGAVAAAVGEAAIRTMMTISGRLAATALVMGPYLMTVAAPFSRRVAMGRYYGVDVDLFRPATDAERAALRERLDLPRDAFLIVLSSRISHEKDPETVLQAVAFARARGLSAVLLNLGGDYREFQALAAGMDVPDAAEWVLGRPAAHPMKELADYYRAADVLVQGSLEEGLGFSPLEALACAVPTVASAVGGLAAHLGAVATLTPRRDAVAMAAAILQVASNPGAARAQARRGREYVVRHWNRARAFAELRQVLAEAAGHVAVPAPQVERA